MNLVFKALSFATIAHKDQFRRETNLPYITHPINVMSLISDVCKGHNFLNDLLIVAALHDTIEDSDTTYNQLVDEFGIVVASMVKELTNIKGYNNKPKYVYITEKIDNMSDLATIVKLADRLDNISDKPSKKVLESTNYIIQNSQKLKTTSNPYIKMLVIALIEKLEPLINQP